MVVISMVIKVDININTPYIMLRIIDKDRETIDIYINLKSTLRQSVKGP